MMNKWVKLSTVPDLPISRATGTVFEWLCIAVEELLRHPVSRPNGLSATALFEWTFELVTWTKGLYAAPVEMAFLYDRNTVSVTVYLKRSNYRATLTATRDLADRAMPSLVLEGDGQAAVLASGIETQWRQHGDPQGAAGPLTELLS